MLPSNLSAEHRGLKQFSVLSLRWLQVLNYSFAVSFALSIPLELIQNVLCNSLPFSDDIPWNNTHDSFNLEKFKIFKSRSHYLIKLGNDLSVVQNAGAYPSFCSRKESSRHEATEKKANSSETCLSPTFF